MDLRAVDTLLRRLSDTGLTAPRPDAAVEWAPTALATARRLRKEAERALGVVLARVDAAGAGDDDAWRLLEDACRRVEQELLKPSSLRSRLEQGRRSLLPKVEARLADLAAPVVEVVGGRLVGHLDDDALDGARGEAQDWTHGWVAYVHQQVDADLAELVELCWSPRQTELPVPAPPLARLTLRLPATVLDLPDVRVERPRVGWGAGFRHARSVLYGVLSAGLLFGLGRDAISGVLMVPVGLAAVAFGYVQASGERAAAEERLADEVRRRADTALLSALRTWLDRQADKIVDDVGAQLLDRRRTFVAWYRTTAIPARVRRDRERAAVKASADLARREQPRLEARVRDLRALEAALADG